VKTARCRKRLARHCARPWSNSRQSLTVTDLPRDTSRHGGSAVDRTQFGRYDLRSGHLDPMLSLRDSAHAHTFNDVALAPGDVYVSETDGNAISRVRPRVDTRELFVQLDSAMNSPNRLGVTPDGRRLYIGCARG